MNKNLKSCFFVKFSILFALIMNGCAVAKPVETHVSKYEAQLSYGMSMEEVKRKLGAPSRMFQHQRLTEKKESFPGHILSTILETIGLGILRRLYI